MKYFIKRKEVGVYCDEEVKRLEGLLKNGVNSNEIGGGR